MKNNRADLRTWRCWLTLVVAVCVISCGGDAQGNSYAIIPWTQGWIAAKADAEARGGHLATITSEAEWNNIWNLFGDDVGGCLLGGTDAGHEGDWSWVTDEPWKYTRWETGEPNNGHDEQHYLWIWAGHDGKWDDVAYNTGTKYLFESENDTNTNITLTANAQTFGAASAGAAILTEGSGSWTAWTVSTWITLNRSNGMAGESCIFVVDANPTADTRTGWIYIEDKVFTVIQTGRQATISPELAEWNYLGGNGEIGVTVEAGVSWTAKANASWLSVTPSSGMGAGSITYKVAAYTNGAAPRTGTLTIAGQTFSVTQEGKDITLSPTTKTLSSSAGTFEVTVTAQAGQTWNVTPNASWISVALSEGQGSRTFVVSVEANPSVLTRTGLVSIGNKTVTITQSGTTVVSLSITPESATASPVGGTGTVAVRATPDEPWTAKALDSWITIADGETGAGNGTISYVASANPMLEPRSGQVKITAQRFYPDVDIARGLASWKGTAYGTPRDKEVPGWTHGYWFQVTQNGTIHRLFGFNNGNAALYVNIDDKLVFQNGSQINILKFNVSTNIYYGLFLVYDGNVTKIYAGKRDSNSYAKLMEFDGELTSVTAGSTQLPSAGSLIYGTAKTGYYVWNRPLNERELAAHTSYSIQPESPSSPLYSNLVSYTSLKTRRTQNASFVPVSGGAQGRDRNGLNQNAMTGDIYPTGRKLCYNYLGEKTTNTVHMAYLSTGAYTYSLVDSGGVQYGASSMNIWIQVISNQTVSTAILFQMMRCSSAGYRVANPSKFCLVRSPNGLYLREGSSDYGPYGGTILNDAQWHMITLTAGNSKYTLYIDGVEQGNLAMQTSMDYYPNGFIPEQWRAIGENQSVWFDEIETFDVCLTSAQVRGLYALEKPLDAIHTVTQGVIDPSVSPTSASFKASGGSGSISVTVAAASQWTAKSSASWISFPGGTNYVGSKSLSYTVSSNPGTSERTATLTLAGKTVTVTQAGQKAQVSYDGTIFGVATGSGVIRIEVEENATWTASSDSSWLTLLNASGQGNAEVMFVVGDLNTSVASRTATVTIAGQTVRITQRGYTLSIDPVVREMGSKADVGEISITVPVDAVWEAIVEGDWITLIGSSMGVGSATLLYAVAENTTGETRRGKIIISGEEHTVVQHPYLTLTTMVEGTGTVTGGGEYASNAQVTVGATPGEGYEFTHWSGDVSGVEPELIVVMDMDKAVTAHFIPAEAAQHLVEEKAAQGGFYTREQMRALAMGDTVIEVEDGTVDLAFELQECADLAGGDWDGVDAGEGEVGVDGEGKVHIKVTPKGNVAFYRLMGGGGESGE